MRLYAGSSVDFIYDSVHNVIADRLRGAFEQQYRYAPSPSEVASWRNSLRAMSGAIEIAGLKDHGVILEYQLPLTSKRLDCMITGHDAAGAANAVIVELKQWETCSEAPGDNEVVSFVGGREREILHPSVQVGRYLDYMRDFHTAFYEGTDAIRATACAFLHNYSYAPDDALTAPKFGEVIKAHPLFVGQEIDDLGGFLTHRLSHGRGMEVLARVESSPYRPSRSLLAHVAQMIKGVPIYTLLDEQLVVFDKVMSLVRPHSKAPGKTCDRVVELIDIC